MQSLPEDFPEPSSQGKDDMQRYMLFKQQVLQRLENNCCLGELLQREFNYHEKIYMECYEEAENKDAGSSKAQADEKRVAKLSNY